MKAAYIERTGPPDVIQYGELPTPEPAAGEIRVKIGAVSVNPIDTYIRNGANYWELPQPFVIGCDFAGTVDAIGEGVTRYAVGDRVWGSNQGLLGRQGTFAEYACVGEQWAYPSPAGVTDADLAAIALVGITAHLGLFATAGVVAGQRLIVNGGSGGVGSMVVQMAKAAGLHVLATAGSPAKVQACVDLGADVAIDYRQDDLAQAVARFAPDGVDVYWETTREPDFDKIVPLLARRGKIVLMAGRDARPPFPVGPFYVKGCSLLGFVMFAASAEDQAAAASDIARWLSEGKLQARIGATLPLSDAARAHRLQEDNTLARQGTLSGKIVLVPE